MFIVCVSSKGTAHSVCIGRENVFGSSPVSKVGASWCKLGIIISVDLTHTLSPTRRTATYIIPSGFSIKSYWGITPNDSVKLILCKNAV